MKLLVATRNDGKAREIRELFSGLPFQLVFPQEQFLERLPDFSWCSRRSSSWSVSPKKATWSKG